MYIFVCFAYLLKHIFEWSNADDLFEANVEWFPGNSSWISSLGIWKTKITSGCENRPFPSGRLLPNFKEVGEKNRKTNTASLTVEEIWARVQTVSHIKRRA